jgi:hypothetical protein
MDTEPLIPLCVHNGACGCCFEKKLGNLVAVQFQSCKLKRRVSHNVPNTEVNSDFKRNGDNSEKITGIGRKD